MIYMGSKLRQAGIRSFRKVASCVVARSSFLRWLIRATLVCAMNAVRGNRATSAQSKGRQHQGPACAGPCVEASTEWRPDDLLAQQRDALVILRLRNRRQISVNVGEVVIGQHRLRIRRRI